MNAPQIVSVLLGEAGITPQELVRDMPELFVRYEFTPSSGMGKFSVKRWEGESYHYIGEVWHDEENEQWMASLVAPGLHRHMSYSVGLSQASERPSKEAAARDLWKLYSGTSEARI